MWEKTNEILVLDDERETEREEAAEDQTGDSQPVPGEQVGTGGGGTTSKKGFSTWPGKTGGYLGGGTASNWGFSTSPQENM